MKRKSRQRSERLGHVALVPAGYDNVLSSMVDLLESARRTSARAVNAVMTAAYWEIGRRIVECEQDGKDQAEYGSVLVTQLAVDLTRRFGRGFSKSNLYLMRSFYLAYTNIFQTPSGKLPETSSGTIPAGMGQTASDLSADSGSGPIFQTPSAKSALALPALARRFPLPWSHYVRLLKVARPEARRFYETEALRGGWSVRQLSPPAGLVPPERCWQTSMDHAHAARPRRACLGGAVFDRRKKWRRSFHQTPLRRDEPAGGEGKHGLTCWLPNRAPPRQARRGRRASDGPKSGNPASWRVVILHRSVRSLVVVAAEYRMTLPDEKTLAAELERTQAALERRASPPKRKTAQRKGGRK